MKLSLSDARDLLSTAIEGGIGYWLSEDCTGVRVSKSPNFGRNDVDLDEWWYNGIEFNSDLSGEKKHYTLTTETMIEKFDAWLAYCEQKMNSRWKQWIAAIDDNDLPGCCDAEDADCFVQFCLFDEVVFG